jgi:hypothetical protein
MIEMHLGEDPIGDDDDDLRPYRNRPRELWDLAVSAPALAIASVVLGFASLTVVQASEELGEAVLFSANSKNPSDLTQLRVSAAVRLLIALVAAVLAISSGMRLRATDVDDPDNDRPADPLWLRGVTGAGLLVALVSIIVTGVALIYVFRVNPGAGFTG